MKRWALARVLSFCDRSCLAVPYSCGSHALAKTVNPRLITCAQTFQSEAKWLLAAVVALTLMNSGVSVAFSFLSRDFWSALNAKDAEHFQEVLVKFFG